jgi:hypothetical protein
MFCWRIPTCDFSDWKESNAEPVAWLDPTMAELDAELKSCKSKIDEPFAENPKRWEAYTIKLEPSTHIRDLVRITLGAQCITNAWLKIIEIFASFGIIPPARPLRMFDNASAPGVFIMAAHYWTTCVNRAPFYWRASTLLDENAGALSDQYGLMETYPDRYTTHGTKFNGDTTDVEYIRYVGQEYGGQFNLYTSDLGMRIPAGKYNCQEAVNARGNLGQVLMGLVVLAVGGTMVTKQFTHMSAFTQSIMAILTHCFSRVYLSKPRTSKGDNSEEYLVCIGYRGIAKPLMESMMAALAASADGYNLDDINFLPPLIDELFLTQSFKDIIIESTRTLVAAQCAKINENIEEYGRMVKNDGVPSIAFQRRVLDPKKISQYLSIARFTRMTKSQYVRVSEERYDRRRDQQRRY